MEAEAYFLKTRNRGVPVMAQWLTNPTRNHEVAGSVPGLAQQWGVAVSCGVGRRCVSVSDPALLWLWHRLATAAPIRPLAWEPPYAMGAALEKAKDKKTKKQKKTRNRGHRKACVSKIPTGPCSVTLPPRNSSIQVTQEVFLFVCLFVCFFATSKAYRSFQARGRIRIRAVATSLYHSYSSKRSKPHLRPIP